MTKSELVKALESMPDVPVCLSVWRHNTFPDLEFNPVLAEIGPNRTDVIILLAGSFPGQSGWQPKPKEKGEA